MKTRKLLINLKYFLNLKTGVILITPVFLFLSHTGLFYLKQPSRPKSNQENLYHLSEKDSNQLREGDIILRRGNGFVSSVINELFQTGYNLSHCAFLTNENGKWYVIHTVSSELSNFDGVQKESLEKFVLESVPRTIITVRLKDKNLDPLKPLMFARNYLKQKIAFDDKFDLSDSTKFYCTELIYKAYLNAFKKDLFSSRFKTDHPNFLSINAFLDTTLFDIIINHQASNP